MSKEAISVMADILASALLIAVPFFANVVLGYIRRMTVSSETNSKVSSAAQLIKEITDSVQVAVEATNQTYVDAIKNSDNPFTKEEQEKAFRQAYDTAFCLLSLDAKKYIAETFGTIEYYLTALIESEVQRQKLKKGSTFELSDAIMLEQENGEEKSE